MRRCAATQPMAVRWTRSQQSFIAPNSRLTSFERLEIYNRQYWFRVLGALAEDFPALRSVIGARVIRGDVRRLSHRAPKPLFLAAQSRVATPRVACKQSALRGRRAPPGRSMLPASSGPSSKHSIARARPAHARTDRHSRRGLAPCAAAASCNWSRSITPSTISCSTLHNTRSAKPAKPVSSTTTRALLPRSCRPCVAEPHGSPRIALIFPSTICASSAKNSKPSPQSVAGVPLGRGHRSGHHHLTRPECSPSATCSPVVYRMGRTRLDLRARPRTPRRMTLPSASSTSLFRNKICNVNRRRVCLKAVKMMAQQRTFLTAEWSNLLMLNYCRRSRRCSSRLFPQARSSINSTARPTRALWASNSTTPASLGSRFHFIVV